MTIRSRIRFSLGALSIAAVAGTLAGPNATAQQAPTAASAPSRPEAGDYVLEPIHSRLAWSTSHFGYSTYDGSFDTADATLTLDPADPTNSRLTMTIDMNSVDAHNAKLEEHLKSSDFFNVAAFPTTRFVSTRVEQTDTDTATVIGDLTMHGITRPARFAVTFNKAGISPVSKAYTVGFSAAGTIKRAEFGIDNYVPAIGDDVALVFSGEFVRPAPTS